MLAKQQFCTRIKLFCNISLPSLHEKLPNCTLMEEVNTQDNDFLFLQFVN